MDRRRHRDYHAPRRDHFHGRAYRAPRSYHGRRYRHGFGPRGGHGYFCSFHNTFHYYSGFDPSGWLIVNFGADLYPRSYRGDCEVVGRSVRRRPRGFRDVALLCYDRYGYPYIKSGSARVYRY